MIKFIKTPDIESTDCVTAEVTSEEACWPELLENFYGFLHACGYCIDREDFGLPECFECNCEDKEK